MPELWNHRLSTYSTLPETWNQTHWSVLRIAIFESLRSRLIIYTYSTSHWLVDISMQLISTVTLQRSLSHSSFQQLGQSSYPQTQRIPNPPNPAVASAKAAWGASSWCMAHVDRWIMCACEFAGYIPLHFQIHGQGLCSCFVMLDYLSMILYISNLWYVKYLHIGLELINSFVSNQQKHTSYSPRKNIESSTC